MILDFLIVFAEVLLCLLLICFELQVLKETKLLCCRTSQIFIKKIIVSFF